MVATIYLGGRFSHILRYLQISAHSYAGTSWPVTVFGWWPLVPLSSCLICGIDHRTLSMCRPLSCSVIISRSWSFMHCVHCMRYVSDWLVHSSPPWRARNRLDGVPVPALVILLWQQRQRTPIEVLRMRNSTTTSGDTKQAIDQCHNISRLLINNP